jgi:hypothetical protein
MCDPTNYTPPVRTLQPAKGSLSGATGRSQEAGGVSITGNRPGLRCIADQDVVPPPVTVAYVRGIEPGVSGGPFTDMAFSSSLRER